MVRAQVSGESVADVHHRGRVAERKREGENRRRRRTGGRRK